MNDFVNSQTQNIGLACPSAACAVANMCKDGDKARLAEIAETELPLLLVHIFRATTQQLVRILAMTTQ
jgi:hypothetical protein